MQPRVCSREQVVSGIGVLDFVLELARHDDQWQASLHYNTDLFDKGTAQRMLGHFMVRMSACFLTSPFKIASHPQDPQDAEHMHWRYGLEQASVLLHS